MATIKNEVMHWIEEQERQDTALARRVAEELNEMRLEQKLAALRETCGLSQSQVARLIGVSQPAIAKLESGQSKNVKLATLVRAVTAMGGRLEISITSPPFRRSARSARIGRFSTARRSRAAAR